MIETVSAPSLRGRRARILVVDDEYTMLTLLERVLRSECEVITATSASEAMALLEAGERFDLVLCDLQMPFMSGVELYEAVQRRWPQLAPSIAFCTAGVDTPSLRDFLASVGERVLSKPFRVGEARALVARCLRSTEETAQAA